PTAMISTNLAKFTSAQQSWKEQTGSIMSVELSKLFVGKTNVRKSPGDVGDLVDSVKEKGILEPVLARPIGGRYELVVGSRRFEAARIAGLKKIPAIVRPMTDEEAIIVSLVENIQRRDIEPEEEYDAIVALRKANPRAYGSPDQIAKALGKSRRYIDDRINAVEAVRSIRRESKGTEISVKQAPLAKERRKGVLPVKHATFLHRAEEAQTVQDLPKRERASQLKELAQTIAPMPTPEAENVVSHFVMAPQRPVEDIKKEVSYLHAVKLEVLLDPRVADGLRRAAEERNTTMEAVATLAIHSWLRQQRYA
ncbi:MAG TPA: ParB/RepB/Spo0J family partition protein, partial [Nitrososphaerales archaeon]|nr:ParB/RepB/Spo0J family partition protein [Nitrososphaerales archaeon]